ncbi:MAG: hypothetical protein K0S93_710, partial [Nitrososphaeraceae archaeon]|nr:hypothetical protein [Nitrososphaeraceae archaeon]
MDLLELNLLDKIICNVYLFFVLCNDLNDNDYNR